MKKLIITGAIAVICFSAFAQTTPHPQQPVQDRNTTQPGLYFDIKTGKPVDLRYDVPTTMMYERASGKPVNFFINGSGDTISSKGFYVVNNYLSLKDSEYMIDKTKTTMRGTKLWGNTINKELDVDKNWKKYTGAERAASDSTH